MEEIISLWLISSYQPDGYRAWSWGVMPRTSSRELVGAAPAYHQLVVMTDKTEPLRVVGETGTQRPDEAVR